MDKRNLSPFVQTGSVTRLVIQYSGKRLQATGHAVVNSLLSLAVLVSNFWIHFCSVFKHKKNRQFLVRVSVKCCRRVYLFGGLLRFQLFKLLLKRPEVFTLAR